MRYLTEYLDRINPTGTEFKTVEELNDRIRQDLVISSISRNIGGQQCGMPPADVLATHEGLNFSMQLWPERRSMLKAKENLMNLFDLYLDELLK